MSHVKVTQYLRPNGRTRIVEAPVQQDIADLVANHDILLSAETLPTGEVAIYARFADDEPDDEVVDLADNGPGYNSPIAVLEGLVKRLVKKKRG